MTVKAAGLTDEQVIEYTWADDKVSWTLVSAGQLKAQDASYTLTPDGDKTKVRFDIDDRPVGADARLRAQAHDEGRDGDRHRRAAQAGAEGQEGPSRPAPLGEREVAISPRGGSKALRLLGCDCRGR